MTATHETMMNHCAICCTFAESVESRRIPDVATTMSQSCGSNAIDTAELRGQTSRFFAAPDGPRATRNSLGWPLSYPERFGYFDQMGQRLRAHLPHHLAAVRLDGDFCYA